MQILPCLPERCVAHVITDPPYEAEAHTLQRRLNVRATGDSPWKRESVQAPVDFGHVTAEERIRYGAQIARMAQRWSLVFCQSEGAVPWREALAPLRYKRTCVWVKPDGMPQLTGDRPGMGYESFVCAHVRGRSRWNGGGRVGVFEHMKNQPIDMRTGHPTTKPESLMLELVELFTDPGDVVLDPFAGSGTTGVACVRRGRRAILIERELRYVNVARERMLAEDSGVSFAAFKAGQMGMFG